jgi:hypothetical protein
LDDGHLMVNYEEMKMLREQKMIRPKGQMTKNVTKLITTEQSETMS